MINFGKVTPEEAIEYFVKKLLLSPEEFAALEQDAKTMAFTVSELSKQTELQFVFDSIKKALEEGQGFAEWKKQTKELWKQKGWSDFRIKTVYQTNMHQAKSVGTWKQIQETKEDFPYLRYSAILDSHTRPSHASMHGKVLPVNDKFWDSFYPPNGFNCRCQAYAITESKAKKFGVTPDVAKVGFADDGWNYNAGKSYDKKLSELSAQALRKTEKAKADAWSLLKK